MIVQRRADITKIHYRFDEVYRFAQQGKYSKRAKATQPKDDCDFILVSGILYKPNDIDYKFTRSCESLEKYRAVKISKSMSGSEKANVKINDAYDTLTRRLKAHYNGKIVEKQNDYCVYLLLEE